MTDQKTFMRAVLALLFVLSAVAGHTAEISGRVVGISDGDTFILLTPDRRQVKVRLAEIDAQERGQPYSSRSRQKLAELVFQKEVRVEVETKDRFGRTVGRPYAGDLDVCAEMARSGAAWTYRQYLRDRTLLAMEKDAKDANRGVWGLSEAQNAPPWEWRRSGNQEGAPEGSNIKGNIGKGGAKIYHVPGSSAYGVSKINPSKKER